jgi:hypothetical protein
MRIRLLLTQLGLLVSLLATPSAAAGGSPPSLVTGGGWFLYADSIPMQFGFSAVVRGDGSATGSFHHFYTADGFTYDFWGTVTCTTFDTVNHRAWVGGVLTKVTSSDPDVGVAPGDDAWFRVLDTSDGDRSTAMGFVGIFLSSAAYCAEQPWPEGNARTHPVTSGQITIHAAP